MGGRRGLARGGAVALRGLALASRFAFIFAAAFYMEPTAFGTYGLIAAGSFVIVQIAGVEAYAVAMRQIATNAAGTDADIRPFYGRFVILSTILAFALGTGLGAAFSWPAHILWLTGALVALEYAGVEATRILAAENRPDLALFAASLRVVPWAIGFPVLTLAGVLTAPWALEAVLWAWLVSAAAALGLLAPVWHRYARPARRGFRCWYGSVLRQSPRWVVIALAPRFLESGVRLVPGAMIGEADAGRFVFLATLAGIGPIAVRAIIEPHFFAAMLDPARADAARLRFARATLAVVALGALASALAWWGVSTHGGKDFGPAGGAQLAALLVAGAALSFAQVAHYRLYAERRDREILAVSAVTLVVGVPMIIALTTAFGISGTAIGAAGAGILLFGLKAWQSVQPARAHARFQTW